jgi:DNA repair protein RadA/Sms
MEENTELKLINMSDVQAEEIKWLWYPFIAYGKMTIVQGDPGDGKSTLVLNIAAKLSRGERLEPEMNIDKPVNVIYQTAEDGLADTVKPRLEQAGADCSRISIIDESEKSLSMIDERIEKAIIAAEAGLLILDPIQAYLGGGTDMNRANEARELTKRLGGIAERTGCAIVLIGHMNKGSGAKAAYRGMGSIDFFAVARSVMLIGRIEGHPDMRAVIQIKNNLAPFGHPKAFELTQDGFHWIGNYEITADEVLGGMVPKASKLEIAKQFLMERSGANVMILSTEIIELAAQEGISKRTLEAAKKELKIKAKKINNSWYWDLRLKIDNVMA